MSTSGVWKNTEAMWNGPRVWISCCAIVHKQSIWKREESTSWRSHLATTATKYQCQNNENMQSRPFVPYFRFVLLWISQAHNQQPKRQASYCIREGVFNDPKPLGDKAIRRLAATRLHIIPVWRLEPVFSSTRRLGYPLRLLNQRISQGDVHRRQGVGYIPTSRRYSQATNKILTLFLKTGKVSQYFKPIKPHSRTSNQYVAENSHKYSNRLLNVILVPKSKTEFKRKFIKEKTKKETAESQLRKGIE